MCCCLLALFLSCFCCLHLSFNYRVRPSSRSKCIKYTKMVYIIPRNISIFNSKFVWTFVSFPLLCSCFLSSSRGDVFFLCFDKNVLCSCHECGDVQIEMHTKHNMCCARKFKQCSGVWTIASRPIQQQTQNPNGPKRKTSGYFLRYWWVFLFSFHEKLRKIVVASVRSCLWIKHKIGSP